MSISKGSGDYEINVFACFEALFVSPNAQAFRNKGILQLFRMFDIRAGVGNENIKWLRIRVALRLRLRIA